MSGPLLLTLAVFGPALAFAVFAAVCEGVAWLVRPLVDARDWFDGDE